MEEIIGMYFFLCPLHIFYQLVPDTILHMEKCFYNFFFFFKMLLFISIGTDTHQCVCPYFAPCSSVNLIEKKLIDFDQNDFVFVDLYTNQRYFGHV